MTELSTTAVGGLEPVDMRVERWTGFDDFTCLAVMNRINFAF